MRDFERFEKIFSLPFLGFAITDTEKQWLEVNDRFLEMLGFKSIEELRNTTWLDLTHPDDRGFNSAVFARLLSGEIDSFTYEKRFIRPDKSVVFVAVSGTAVRDEHGKIEYFIAFYQDISTRKAVELQLEEQRAFLREVLDASPNAIFAKHRDGTFAFANRTMSELYGKQPEEMVGLRDQHLGIPQSDVEYFARIDQAVFDTKEAVSIPESTHIDPETKAVSWFHTIKRPLIDANGQVSHVLAVASDITERKRAEEKTILLQRQLLQSQKLEAIGKLAAGVAHDLNNALAAVVGHLQLLKSGAAEPNSVDVALEGCARASGLIDQLLGFSRQGRYTMEPLALMQLVNGTLQFLGKVISKDMRLVVQPYEQPLFVNGDSAQLQQALTNLIINAQQSMQGKGTITISFDQGFRNHPQRFNQNAQAGMYARINVTDTGTGIEPALLDKIFEPFFTTKADGKGTGLGLSMVYGIMQSHGGWVEVDSSLGVGSTFSLHFPLIDPPAREGQKAPKLPRKSQPKGTVLVVDDEQVLVDLTAQFLRNANLTAVTFTSAKEALAWFRDHSSEVDLTIIDMKMPGIDGPELFAQLRAVKPGASVIILSGYSEDEVARNLLKAGALRFFHKPLHYPDLIDWIIEYLGRQAQVDVIKS